MASSSNRSPSPQSPGSPQSPQRQNSQNTIGLHAHAPNTPSRLREILSRSPGDQPSYFNNKAGDNTKSEDRASPPILNPQTSIPMTAEPRSQIEDGDNEAHATLIEPTRIQEDERTALLESYRHHRVNGLRKSVPGSVSRAGSFMSTAASSVNEGGMRYPEYAYTGEHEQPTDFVHAVLGDPIADALMGSSTKDTRKYLKQKYGLRHTKFAYFAYYLPCIKWITQYSWLRLRGDFLSAFTMASFYIPMSLSYASNLGHVPPINGLYAFVAQPLIYAILGSCPQMTVGPEAPGSLLVGTVIATSIESGNAGEDEDALHAQIAGVVTATAGAIIFVAGLTRLGFLDSVLSKPFLRGFICAIGFVIFVDQAIPEFGLSELAKTSHVQHGSTVVKLLFLIKNVGHSHRLTAIVSWSAFVVIMLFREIKKRLQPRFPMVAFFPDRFVVVVVATILAWKLDWSSQGLENLGKVAPSGHGVLSFHWPFRFEHMKKIDAALTTSLIIALLGFFESSVAARSLGDGNTGLKGVDVSANRELIALGTANFLGGCFMSLPAFGGYGRSKVNVSTGGTTPMSSAILSMIALLCVFFALPYFYYIPKGVLSAMISVVAYSLIEEAPHDIKFFVKIRGWSELALMTGIFLATIFWSLTVGIALGMGLSLLQIVRHATKPRIQILGRVAGTPDKFENAEGFAEDIETVEGCLIVKIPEPLTFANTGALKNRLRRLERYGTESAHPSLPHVRTEEHNKNVIFDVHGVTSIDGSGTQVLTEIIQGYIEKGSRVVFCRLPRKRSTVYQSFQKSGIVELVGGRRHFVGSINEALKLAEAEDLEEYFAARTHASAA